MVQFLCDKIQHARFWCYHLKISVRPGSDGESDAIGLEPAPITPGTPPDPYLFVRLTRQPDA